MVQDSKYLETEKHQLKRYFTKIAERVDDVDELSIYGPAEAPDKFLKDLEENHPQLASKVRVKEKVDRMTKNQFRALVKGLYEIDERFL